MICDDCNYYDETDHRREIYEVHHKLEQSSKIWKYFGQTFGGLIYQLSLFSDISENNDISDNDDDDDGYSATWSNSWSGENNDQTRYRMIAFFLVEAILMIHYNGNDQNDDDYGQNDDDDQSNDDRNNIIIAVMMIGLFLTVHTWML